MSGCFNIETISRHMNVERKKQHKTNLQVVQCCCCQRNNSFVLSTIFQKNAYKKSTDSYQMHKQNWLYYLNQQCEILRKKRIQMAFVVCCLFSWCFNWIVNCIQNKRGKKYVIHHKNILKFERNAKLTRSYTISMVQLNCVRVAVG